MELNQTFFEFGLMTSIVDFPIKALELLGFYKALMNALSSEDLTQPAAARALIKTFTNQTDHNQLHCALDVIVIGPSVS
jgi:hypothetical protein